MGISAPRAMAPGRCPQVSGFDAAGDLKMRRPATAKWGYLAGWDSAIGFIWRDLRVFRRLVLSRFSVLELPQS